MDERGASVTILALFFLFLVIYALVLYESYKKGWGIFAPYHPPPPPPNTFYPLGEVRPLTSEQIARQREVIRRGQ
jgi:hypothetical protein